MTSAKSLKKALLCSVMALTLCFTMLLGTTYAWFTDSVTNNVNQIVAGNLDVELKHSVNYASNPTEVEVVESTTKLYDELLWNEDWSSEEKPTTWQPDVVAVEYYVIENKGTLPLRYKFTINFTNATTTATGKTLADVLLVEVVGITEDHAQEIGTMEGASKLKNFVLEGTLDAGEKYEFLTGIGWEESATDNDFNVAGGLKIDLGVTLVATQTNPNAEYPVIKTESSLEEAFEDVNFAYNSTSTEEINLDGKGVTTVTDFTDAWFSNNVTIKGVTFKNGATFSAKNSSVNATITLEDCVFYACDQQKLIDAGLARIDNSGAGLCLDIETSNSANVKVVVKNCKFVGEGDETIVRKGYKNWTSVNNGTLDKARGYGLAINGVAGQGTAKSVLIDGCEFTGIRDNAIQLYTFDYEITVKNCVINGWGYNADDAAGTHTGAAIRGDIKKDSEGSLVLSNNYFGEDETSTSYHVKVDNSTVNTDGTRVAGTY